MESRNFRIRLLLWIAGLTRKFGIPPGGERLLNFLFPIKSFSSSEAFVIEFDQGLWAKLFLQSHMERRLFFSGGYQGENEKAIQSLLKPGFTAFDCGANIGSYALRMAKAVFPNGKVFAFEPHLPIVEKLRINIRLSGFQDVIEVITDALSESPGKTVFYFPPEDSINQGNASLSQFSIEWESREVSIATIDGFVQERGLSRVDLIRAEVQGHELQLLKGAHKTISDHLPMFSFRNSILWPAQKKLNFDEIISFLSGFGYLPYFLFDTSFIPIPADSVTPPFGNYLFLSQSHRQRNS